MIVTYSILLFLVVSSCSHNSGENGTSVDSGQVQSTVILETSKSWDGTMLQYPEGQARATVVVIEIAPGAETGMHYHPVPNFGYMLEGELEVELEDGRSFRIEKGEAISEVVDVLHSGRNTGQDIARIVVFYAGSEDKPLTVMEEERTPF